MSGRGCRSSGRVPFTEVAAIYGRLVEVVLAGYLPLTPASVRSADRFTPRQLHVTNGADVATATQLSSGDLVTGHASQTRSPNSNGGSVVSVDDAPLVPNARTARRHTATGPGKSVSARAGRGDRCARVLGGVIRGGECGTPGRGCRSPFAASRWQAVRRRRGRDRWCW